MAAVSGTTPEVGTVSANRVICAFCFSRPVFGNPMAGHRNGAAASTGCCLVYLPGPLVSGKVFCVLVLKASVFLLPMFRGQFERKSNLSFIEIN
jgi:hypothetical protein